MTEHRTLTTLMRPFLRRQKDAPFRLPGTVTDGARVLAIDVGDLAEMLFYIPLLAAIRRRYPGASIDFLLPENHAPLVVPSGLARQCLVYKPQQLKPWRPSYGSLLRSLGKPGYDVAVLMSMDAHAELELACLASGAVLRLGPSHETAYPTVNVELRSMADGDVYRGDRLGPLAPFLGLASERLESGWPLPEDRRRQCARLVHFNKPDRSQLLVGIDPGLGKTGHGIAQQNLLFLTRQLATQARCRFLPLSDPDNQDRLREFERSVGDVPPGLARDTLMETVLLLSQCDLFLAGNTDLFHFAVALGVPSVGFFTPGDGKDWEPRGRRHCRVLRVSRGERVDVATLMEAVEAVRGAPAVTTSPLRPAPDAGAGGGGAADAADAAWSTRGHD
ncbi:MAG: glycosyltransferase family 9 protein [Candidatus Krumholzibacteriia bacterium]